MNRRFNHLLDALAQGRRPRRVALTEEQARIAAMAASLRAAGADASTPDPDFVNSLGRRLRQAADSPSQGQRGWHRREFIAAAAGAAAAAAVGGVAADRLLNPGSSPSQPYTPSSPSELVPDSGSWQRVGAVSQLDKGAVLAFQTSAVSGFVSRSGEELTAVSAICTHLGCTLWHSASDGLLHCPCHTQTAFALDGMVKRATYTLPPLPRLQARISGGDIEVLLPPSSTPHLT